MTWNMVAIGDVATIERNSVQPHDIKSGEKYVGLENIKTGGEFLNVGCVSNGDLASSKFAFTNNHVLFGKLRPYLAKIALPDFDGICSTDILPILPSSKLDASYLRHVLLQQKMVDKVNALATGANLPRISPKALCELKIPLPTLEEQKRIAAILDKAAEIKAKREKVIAALDELEQILFFNASTEAKEYGKLGELCDVRDGTHDSPKYVSDGYPLITSKNIFEGVIDKSTASLVSKEDYIEINKRSKVDHGDILMPMIGTIGNPAVVIDRDPQFAIKNVALIKFKDTSTSNIYINAFLKSKLFHQYVTKNSRGGTQKFLGLGDIRKIEVPVLAVDVQNALCKQILCISNLRDKAKKELVDLQHLMISLQHKAFTTGFNA